jgi:pyruvate/2-oxoglutarate dehydrogenase complex dihydrolipoamide acyltransferase (E2) component
VAEIETEKATVELEAPEGGILHPVAEVGTLLPLQALVGYILADGEAPPKPPLNGQPAVPDGPPETALEAPAVAAPGGVRASPIARRLAAEHGIDLTGVKGTGPGGRIVEADVMAARADVVLAAPLSPLAVPWKVRERVPLKGMRRSIADRLRHSLATAASITIMREVRADALKEARGRLKHRLGIAIPWDALFVKLLAGALREHVVFNSTVEQDAIVVVDEVHVGFAVALPGGLVVPVVHDADTRPLGEVALSVQELRGRALAGRLRPADVAGGTASISNLGAYGVDAFTPILNPPQSAILGIGRIAERAVAEDGRIVLSATCVLSLTFDHRVADGAPAAQLLEWVARRMSDPHYLENLSN